MEHWLFSRWKDCGHSSLNFLFRGKCHHTNTTCGLLSLTWWEFNWHRQPLKSTTTRPPFLSLEDYDPAQQLIQIHLTQSFKLCQFPATYPQVLPPLWESPNILIFTTAWMYTVKVISTEWGNMGKQPGSRISMFCYCLFLSWHSLSKSPLCPSILVQFLDLSPTCFLIQIHFKLALGAERIWSSNPNKSDWVLFFKRTFIEISYNLINNNSRHRYHLLITHL